MIPIRVSDIRLSSPGGAEVSARVDGLPFIQHGERLWFRFPPDLSDSLGQGAEAFLAALLPVAMDLGRKLIIEATVSEQLLSGCQQIMSQYAAWDHRLHSVELQVRAVPIPQNTAHATACFFTAGVDSFYTLLKNLDREASQHRISHLLFVRGYANCLLESEQLFEHLFANLQSVASTLNLKLLTISSNLHSFIPPRAAGWDWYASSVLAAPALCLAPMLRRVLIPSGDTYSTLSPWGSHPLIDPLWSTETLEFVHDGCEASRAQKLERYVAKSKIALAHLRVCDFDQSGIHNCGTCEKCLRTQIALRALRIDTGPEIFAQPIGLDRIARLDGGEKVIGYYLRDNLNLLRRHGPDQELEAALLRALRGDPLRWLSRQTRVAAQELDRVFLNGRIRNWMLSEAARKRQDSEVRLSPFRWAVSHLYRSPKHDSERGIAEDERQHSCL
jgi:hypothetical protein